MIKVRQAIDDAHNGRSLSEDIEHARSDLSAGCKSIRRCRD
jgi:hypothetical protein